MKNKILLSLTFIISFTMYTCVAKAEKACYVCEETGEYVWDEEPSTSCKGNWSINADIKNEKNCKYECNDRNECESGKWLAKCEYKEVGGDEKLYIYYNSFQKKIFIGNDTLETVQDNVPLWAGACKYGDGIELKELINEYETGEPINKGCPSAVYYKVEAVSGGHGSVGKCHEFSLDAKGANFNSDNSNDKYYSLVVKDTKDDEPKKDFNPTSCDDLIGNEIKDIINNIMKYIRIAVPILLIGFGIIDFAKATFSSKEDDMKKSREVFIKRIIAAVLVFLAPIIVNLILDLANNVWSWINPDTCIK